MTRHCYAKVLGDCAGKLTLEHFVSRSLLVDLEPIFVAEGLLPADPAAAIKTSARSVATRVLCRAHNTVLSEVDSATVPFLSAARRFDHELSTTSAPSGAALVDGHMLERWLVKATLGLVARPGSSSTLPTDVHRHLVAVAFGAERLAAPWGVHLDISPDRPMASVHDFALVALVNPATNECRAATFSSASIRWLLALGKSGLPDHAYRPQSVVLRSPTATRTLEISWPPGTGAGLELSLDRQTFDASTVPEVFTPTGSVAIGDLRSQ